MHSVVDLATNYDIDPTTSGLQPGHIVIALYDEEAPITVSNFLRYVTNYLYDQSFFHRLVSGFVLQGGGYKYDGTNTFTVNPYPPIPNEFSPTRSNVAGTIAMATISGDPNSATSQFFFNLADNSANLDVQNGGFTVFGTVVQGWNVVAGISSLPVINSGFTFDSLPVQNYATGPIQVANLVVLTSATVVPSVVPSASLVNDTGIPGDGITRDPTLIYTNSPDATLSYSVDGGPYGPTAPVFATNSSQDGQHTVRVRATDLAGNITDGVSNTFFLDTTPPATPTVSLANDTGTPGDGITRDPTLTYAHGADSTLSYSVDGGAYGAAPPVFATDGSQDGRHSVAVRATDLAGNITDGTSNTVFVLKTTISPADVPSVQLVNDTGTPGDGVTHDPTLAYTQGPGTTLGYSVDGGAYGATAPVFLTDGSQDGQHIVRVRATDLAGNISDGSSNTIFVLDTTPPSAPTAHLINDTGASVDGVTRDPTLAYTHDPDSTLSYSVDGSTYGATLPFFATDGSQDGQHIVRVRATDLAGNVTDGTSNTIFLLDTTAPPAPTAGLVNDTGTPGDGLTRDPTLAYTHSPDSTLSYSVDGGAYGATAPVFATDGSQDGRHAVGVRATDLAGNVTDGTSNTIFILDRTPPTATVPGVSLGDGSVRFIVAVSEAVSGVDATDFHVATTGSLTGAAISGVSQIDPGHYALDVSTGTGDGGLALTLVAAGSGIVDAAGNPLAADVAGVPFARSHDHGLTQERATFQDGHQQIAIRDSGNTQSWATNNLLTDRQGHVSVNQLIYDDGHQAIQFADTANTQPWAANNLLLDAAGRVVVNQLVYDDGHQEIAIKDVANTQPWAVNNLLLDPAGKLAVNQLVYDDGHQDITINDVANTQPFTSNSLVLDPNGVQIANSVVYDDGHVVQWHI